MNLKPIKLNENDINLLKFLARFKLLCANNAINFYGSSYYQKRLQELKNANYITRYYRIYIKLTPACIRYLESLNIKCEIPCRNKEYIDRLDFISELGIELQHNKIPIKLSWEMKGNNYTDWSRRFLGEIILKNEKYLVYYAKTDPKYIRQMQFDINKDLSYQNVIIFVDGLNVINNKKEFVFPNKTSCILVHRKDINNLAKFDKIIIKEEIEKHYGKVAKSSDFSLADYKIEDRNIIYMPFIDTHKIVALNSFYSLDMADSNLEILTLKKNFEIIAELLSEQVLNKTNILETKLIQEEKNE